MLIRTNVILAENDGKYHPVLGVDEEEKRAAEFAKNHKSRSLLKRGLSVAILGDADAGLHSPQDANHHA